MQQGSLPTSWSGRSLAPGAYALSLGVDARSLELPERAGNSRAQARGAASRFALLGSLGVWRGIDVSAGVAVGRLFPLGVPADREASLDGNASTTSPDTWLDLRLVPRLQLWADASGSGLGLLLPMWLPRGAPAAYADPGLRLAPRLAVNARAGVLGVTLNAGYVAHAAGGPLGKAPTDFARVSAGVELRIDEGWSILSEVVGRWWPRTRAAGEDDRFTGEARLAGRYMSGGWALQAGAGRGVTGDSSEPAWRMLANVSFSSDAFDEPATLAPPPPTKPTDTPPPTDPYPNERSDWQASSPALDARDTATSGGPEASGAELTPLPSIDVVLNYRRYQIDLDRHQRQQLKKVARELSAAAPDVRLVIEGHTDDTGPRAPNRKLSRLRAATARQYLVQLGIPRRRIDVESYGASRPVPGRTQPGAHRTNRRVVFRLVRANESAPGATAKPAAPSARAHRKSR
jgi:outer membrane protein OmpA-like peptidoglycan-associated protein